MQATKTDTRLELPSEHGFWVMLLVILVAGAGLADFALAAIGVAVGLGVVGAVAGGRFHRQVRKSPLGQVLASALLGALLVPIAGTGQVPVGRIAADALAWVTIFASFSLTVRSVFSRASKKGNSAAITALALVLPAASALILFWQAHNASLPISIVGVGGAILFAVWRPKPRDLKHSGLMMTVLLVLALVLVLVG